jgi:signal transduction histidine kinase
LGAYEKRAFALYFVNDIRYPYVSATALSLLCAWLMYGKVSTTAIALWMATGTAANAVRELFVKRMKPRLAQGQGHATILHGFALSSLVTGLIWGGFALMYFDAEDPTTILVVGFIVAGQVGAAATPLSIYLPAYYLYVLATLLPYTWLLATTGDPVHMTLAVVSLLFQGAMANYARVTNRLHRESVRLRHENQSLIADLEVRNAEVETTSRNKSLFLAGVSHDLKQPIRAIALYTGFLRQSASSGAGSTVVTQTADKIGLAVSAIHSQIGRLLELSRLESGAMPMNIEPIDLDDTLSSVRNMMASQAQARGVQLRFAMGRNRQVWADRRMLDSILTNFVSNAIKHAGNGRIYIGTRLRAGYPEGQRLCIEVRDSGVGIAAERLPLLFDAYRSFDDRQASESHGLGLAIAKAQATYLGCEIAVASQPGCGSVFTLCGLSTVPIDDQPELHFSPEHMPFFGDSDV